MYRILPRVRSTVLAPDVELIVVVDVVLIIYNTIGGSIKKTTKTQKEAKITAQKY